MTIVTCSAMGGTASLFRGGIPFNLEELSGGKKKLELPPSSCVHLPASPLGV